MTFDDKCDNMLLRNFQFTKRFTEELQKQINEEQNSHKKLHKSIELELMTKQSDLWSKRVFCAQKNELLYQLSLLVEPSERLDRIEAELDLGYELTESLDKELDQIQSELTNHRRKKTQNIKYNLQKKK